MDGLDLEPADVPPAPATWRRDASLLLILVFLAAGLRFWQITHTEVVARDTISFIRYAWQLEQRPVLEVLKEGEQHPGYPAAIWLVSRAVQHLDQRPMSEVMELSAQLASALASLLLVFPVFYLGKELFDRRASFWACFLFQCLPASSRVLADGLTEALFLLFGVSSLLFAVRALRGNRVTPFILCGLCSGLAYLTRPEGAIIAAMTGVVLLALQFRAQRRAWWNFLRCGLGLGVASLALAGPFIAVTGKLTVKPSAARLALLSERSERAESLSPPLAQERSWTSGPPVAVWYGFGEDLSRFWWSFYALGFDLVKGYFYITWLPVLIGLWWFRDRFRAPGALVMLLVCLCIMLLLWRVAVVIGYASDRHLLLPILCGLYWGTAAILDAPRRFALSPATQRWSAVAALLVLAGTALPRSMETIHGDRAGFREAGLWIADHMEPSDVVFDPYCWSHYFAGQVFAEVTPTPPPPDDQRTAYIVLEHSQHEHIRLPLVNLCLECAKQGHAVYQASPRRRGNKPVEVVVYALPLTAVQRIKAGELHAAARN